jgi:hypothetical protein
MKFGSIFIMPLSFFLCLFVPDAAMAGRSGNFAFPGVFRETVGVMLHDDSDHFVEDVSAIAKLGVHYIRTDVRWRWVDLGDGLYDFDRSDKLIEAILSQGMRPYIVLGSINKKYGDEGFPRSGLSREAFARWALAMVARYKGKGVVWEIWNEPNHKTYWRPVPDASEYGELLLDVSCKIKGQFSDEYVVGGVLAGVDLGFAEKLKTLGALRCLSAFSVHPYRDSSPETVVESYAKIRNILGDNVPIFAGEWGYSTFDRGVIESVQADYLQRAFLIDYVEGVPLTVWYSWRDPSDNRLDKEANFGVLRFDRRAKPARDGILKLMRSLIGVTSVISKKVNAKSGVQYVIFRRSQNNSLLVTWAVGSSRTLKIGNVVLGGEFCSLVGATESREILISESPAYCDIFDDVSLGELQEALLK